MSGKPGGGDRDTSLSKKPMTRDEVFSHMKANLSENKYGKLEESIKAMKSTSLLIGITGPSAVGKSSFINNMLGLEEGDEGAAEIGEGDTTTTCKVYSHPDNDKLKFSDFPGFGTPSFQLKDEYLKTINAEDIDFFLIFYCTTISEGDIWMIKKLIQLKKKFAIVRTRADDLNRRKGKTLLQGIEEVKTKAKENLKKTDIQEQVDVFVISNVSPDIGEFDALFKYIQSNLPEIKKEAIVLHVNALTEKIIDEKEKQLKKRAWKVAAGIGAVSAVPIPGIELPFSLATIMEETNYYLKTFGLTEEILRRFPEDVRKELETAYQINNVGVKDFIKASLAKIPLLVSATFIEQAIEMFLPFIGSVITGGASFALHVNFLLRLIKDLAEDAKKLRRRHAKLATYKM